MGLAAFLDLIPCVMLIAHTHTHTHTLRLWSKASYRVLLIFHPKSRPEPRDPPLKVTMRRHRASLRARMEHTATGRLCHIRPTRLDSRWRESGDGTLIYMSAPHLCLFSRRRFFFLLQFKDKSRQPSSCCSTEWSWLPEKPNNARLSNTSSSENKTTRER